MVDCKNCIDKCPQAERASLIAKDRMYKTQLLVEYIKLGTVEELRSAKEKQMPKKPMQYISDRADTPYVAYKCSVCKSEEELYEYQPYCSECGNKIDWSDFE